MEIKIIYEKYKKTPIIYAFLILIGIFIRAAFDIITFAGTLLNFIFNYDFDTSLFRNIPTINMIYLIFSIIISILCIKYIYDGNKKKLIFSGTFIVATLIVSRFIISGIAISVINLYYNLEVIIREDIYIFLPSTIYLLIVSSIIMLVSIIFLYKEKITLFNIIIIVNLIFGNFSKTYFDTLLSRADGCFRFFDTMNDIYRTRGLEIDCPIFITLYLQKIYPLINLGFYLILVILICRYLKKNNINLFRKKES